MGEIAVTRGPSSRRLERVAFRVSRLLDFVGARELTAQIGHGVADWPLDVFKELADNALDSAEEAGVAPEIAIAVSTAAGSEAEPRMGQGPSITISDNGPGLLETTVADILDYSMRVSSREAYVSPTRGAQGNALKTIIAMPHALDGTSGVTLIESRRRMHLTGAEEFVRAESSRGGPVPPAQPDRRICRQRRRIV